MKQLLLIVFLGMTSFYGFSQKTAPGGVQGAMLWVNTQPEGGQQYILKDRITQKSLAKQSKAYSMNNNPGLLVGKSGSTFQGIPLKQSTKITFISVFSQFDASNEEVLLSVGNGESNESVLTGERLANLSDCSYLNFDEQGNRQYPRIYTYVQNKQYDSLNAQNLMLFIAGKPLNKALPVKEFNGVLPEMVLYDRVLSYSELRRVQSYFSLKYGISLDQETMPLSYYNAKNHKIWDAEKHLHYKYRITGIGRDDLSGLNQRISTNVAALGLPKIQLSAKDSLDDNYFLLWADNGKRLHAKRQNGFAKKMDRTWLAQSYGNFAGKGIDLEMDVLYFEERLQGNDSFWLVWDKSGTGNYPVGKTLYMKQNRKEKNSVFFDNVAWDSSFCNQTHFGLIQAPDFFVHSDASQPVCFQQENGSLKLEMVGGSAPYKITLTKEGKPVHQSTSEKAIAEIANLEAGIYHLIVVEGGGKSYEDKIFLTHQDIPLVELQESYLLAGNPLQIDASAKHPENEYNFVWRKSGDIVSTNAVLETGENGLYQLEVCNSKGCRQMAETEVVSATKSNFKEVLLYPNPTKGEFYIRIHLYAPSAVDVRIYDINGRLVKQSKLSENSDFHVYEGFLPYIGTYVVELRSGESVETVKVINN